MLLSFVADKKSVMFDGNGIRDSTEAGGPVQSTVSGLGGKA